MILDTITKSLEILLGAAQVTSPLQVTVSYVEMTSLTTLGASSDSQSNGVTPVTILAAPAAATQRKLNTASVYNNDTVAQAVIVRLNNGGTLRRLVGATLQVGDTLIYTDAQGWFVFSSTGVVKTGIGAAVDVAVTPVGGLSSTNVQEALAELDSEKIPLTYMGTALGVATLDVNNLVPITQLPPAALERLVIVADQTARYALTITIVQNGDTVRQIDTGEMWYVIDQTNLGNAAGYAIYTAGTATAVAWSGITGMPVPVTALLGTNTGDVTLGVVGATPNANGASLTGQVLTLQPASATQPGLMTAGTQAIGGTKTFTGAKASATLAEGSNGLEFADAQFVNSQDNLHTDHKLNAMGIDLIESATVGTLTAPSSANNNVGTYNFTIPRTIALPDWTPSANVVLMHKHDGVTGYIVTLLTTGVFRLTMNATNYDSTVANTLPNGATATIAPIVTRPSVSTAGSVVFKVGEYTLGAAVTIPAGAPADLDNASPLYISGTSTTRHASRNHAARVFNRAMTDAEWSLFVQKGVDYSDIGANQAGPTYTSNHSATVDGWAAFAGCTVAGNVDGVGGLDDWLEATATAATVQARRAGVSTPVLMPYKRSRITLTYYIPVTNTAATLQFLGQSTATPTFYSAAPVKGTATTITFEALEAEGLYGLRLYVTGNTVGDKLYLRGITSTPIGAIADYSPPGIQPNQWHDGAPGDSHVALPASGATLSMWKETGQYNWTIPILVDTTLTNIIPAGWELESVLFYNSTANPVDIGLGTSAGGTQIFAATTIAANGYTSVAANKAFSLITATTLYLWSLLWNSASITMILRFRRIS